MKARLQDGSLIISPDFRGGTVLVYVCGRVEQWSERAGVIVPGSGLAASDGSWGDGPKCEMKWNGQGMDLEHERKVAK